MLESIITRRDSLAEDMKVREEHLAEYDYYTNKLADLVRERDKVLSSGKQVKSKDQEKLDRNQHKLNEKKTQYEAFHAKLSEELDDFLTKRFDMIAPILMAVFNAERVFASKMLSMLNDIPEPGVEGNLDDFLASATAEASAAAADHVAAKRDRLEGVAMASPSSSSSSSASSSSPSASSSSSAHTSAEGVHSYLSSITVRDTGAESNDPVVGAVTRAPSKSTIALAGDIFGGERGLAATGASGEHSNILPKQSQPHSQSVTPVTASAGIGLGSEGNPFAEEKTVEKLPLPLPARGSMSKGVRLPGMYPSASPSNSSSDGTVGSGLSGIAAAPPPVAIPRNSISSASTSPPSSTLSASSKSPAAALPSPGRSLPTLPSVPPPASPQAPMPSLPVSVPSSFASSAAAADTDDTTAPPPPPLPPAYSDDDDDAGAPPPPPLPSASSSESTAPAAPHAPAPASAPAPAPPALPTTLPVPKSKPALPSLPPAPAQNLPSVPPPNPPPAAPATSPTTSPATSPQSGSPSSSSSSATTTTTTTTTTTAAPTTTSLGARSSVASLIASMNKGGANPGGGPKR